MPKKPDDEERDDAHPLRRPLSGNNFESVVDKLLAKARAEGQFRDLQGQGKPLERDHEEALVPEDMRAGYRMLKNGGFAPPWIEARKAIEEERTEAALWLRRANDRWPRIGDPERAKLRAEYRTRIENLQRSILNYNLTVPESAGQIPGIKLREELEKLGA